MAATDKSRTVRFDGGCFAASKIDQTGCNSNHPSSPQSEPRQRSLALPAGAAPLDFRKRSLASPDDALDSSCTLGAITHADSGLEEYSRRRRPENRYCCCGRRARSYYDWPSDSSCHCCSTNRRAAPGGGVPRFQLLANARWLKTCWRNCQVSPCSRWAIQLRSDCVTSSKPIRP